MQARAARRFLSLGFFVAGGSPGGYTPVAPHVATRPALAASVTRIHLDRGLAVTLRVDTAGPVRLRRVLLAPHVAEPCHEGVREVDITVDDQRQWARPTEITGKHEIALRYSAGSASDLLARPSALDVVVAGDGGAPDQCLRVELTGASRALAWNDHIAGTVGGELRVMAPIQSVDGVGAGWSFGARMGGYAGPVRIMGELGLGTAHCTGVCYGDIGFL